MNGWQYEAEPEPEPEPSRQNGRDGPPRQLKPVNPATLAGRPIPQRRWVVPEWIQIARAAVLYGAGGEGKTMLAQMLATACALKGATWLGLPVLHCNSLSMFCEDDLDEMHLRQELINDFYGCTWADLGGMLWLPLLGADNILMTFENGRAERTPLFDEVLEISRQHNARLNIFDTLTDVFDGDENKRAQARRFTQQGLGYLARETDSAALALGHPSRAGISTGSGDSGTTGWVATFRTQMTLTTPDPTDDETINPDEVRTLTRHKSNAARRGDEIELRWKNGVLVPTKAPLTGFDRTFERHKARRVFLELLARVSEEGRTVSDKVNAGNYAPRLFARRPDREGLTVDDFRRAMEALFVDKTIKIGRYEAADRHSYNCIVKAE